MRLQPKQVLIFLLVRLSMLFLDIEVDFRAGLGRTALRLSLEIVHGIVVAVLDDSPSWIQGLVGKTGNRA